MTNSLLFRLFRHPIFAEAEILEKRTELSAILIAALHGVVLMLITIYALAERTGVTTPFAILYALLWGPPVFWFVSWLFSNLTWFTGRLCKGNVERAKIVVLQSWATVPLFVLWLIPFLDAVFHPSILKKLPEWVGLGFLCLVMPLLLSVSLAIYGSGLRHLYDLTLKQAIGRTTLSVLLNVIVLTLLIYLFFQTVSFDFFHWS